MVSAELSRRIEKVVGYPTLLKMEDRQRRVFHEALLDADSFEDLPESDRQRSSKPSRTGRSYAWSLANSGSPRFIRGSLLRSESIRALTPGSAT
jgi:hypothetical protein